MLNPKHLGVGPWPLNTSWGSWGFLGLELGGPAYHLALPQPQGLSFPSEGAGATGIWDNLV